MNSNSKKKWTTKEEAVLMEQVKRSPENLNKAFMATSKLIGRSKSAVSSRWYYHVSKDYNNPAFVCISKKSYGVNRKNCRDEFTNIKENKDKQSFIMKFIHKVFH